MTDQERIAQQFGLTIEQLNATSPHERERAIAESLSSDERSMAAMFKMSEADIAEMVSDRAEEFTPAEAVARLNALGKAGQGRLLALNAAAGHRLYAQAAKVDSSFCSFRDATADLVRASGGKASKAVKASASPEIHRGAPTKLVRLTTNTEDMPLGDHNYPPIVAAREAGREAALRSRR